MLSKSTLVAFLLLTSRALVLGMPFRIHTKRSPYEILKYFHVSISIGGRDRLGQPRIHGRPTYESYPRHCGREEEFSRYCWDLWKERPLE